MGRSLVLNASDQPLAVVTAQRAVVLVLKEKADVVVSNGAIFHAERFVIEAPSVVRLRYFVRVPYRAQSSAHAPGGVRPRRLVLPVLRGARREPRPRHPEVPGRTAHVGERRGRVPPVQLAEGEPPRRATPACAFARRPSSPRTASGSPSGGSSPSWEPYLWPEAAPCRARGVPRQVRPHRDILARSSSAPDCFHG